MRLSKNFSLKELTHSPTAHRLGINNKPTQADILRLEILCRNVLQPLRDALGFPIRVNSGYRSPELNRAIGGSPTSDHMMGRAADIEAWQGDHDNLLIMKFLRDSPVEFKQLIWEFGGAWIHVSYQQGHNRGEVLEAYKNDAGRTQYRPWRGP